MTENNIIKDTFILNLTYEMSINADTGEILETKLINRTVNKPEEKSSPKRKNENIRTKIGEVYNKITATEAPISNIERK